MSLTPQPYNRLLEVFYFGLKWGLVIKADVVKWSDDIIMAAEEDLDYFFIELSMSKNVNEVMELIESVVNKNTDPIVGRVFLGLTYRQLEDNIIELQKVCAIMDNIALLNTLTDYENDSLYQLADELQEALQSGQLEYVRTETLEFLVLYEDFVLNNYHEWPAINQQVETHVFNMTQQIEDENEAYEDAQKRTAAMHKFTIKMVLYMLILGAETVIITKPNLEYKFNKDLYALSLLVFGIAMCYPVVWIIYRSLIKLFRV
ncbi:hypothetical protein FHW88_001046 [Mucilaginibacter sp. SG538B]|uniref:hypothetical protein n=1 Tax=Mucilaginibacter sp. SG538B TaxID=2587021 RepID=UPI00159E583F|nr:hypothetical protein [Mucilaginibacter sp. SG538B]NVM62770.1 hypothetical protein [Mucilaginibacter sp. SG538B]